MQRNPIGYSTTRQPGTVCLNAEIPSGVRRLFLNRLSIFVIFAGVIRMPRWDRNQAQTDADRQRT